ncbi:MAG: ABC transporter substrate-binding protein, partial [Candidatus Eremiobacteraeota bacterium]|nr:ABC transporter substrate-binding protein [Candidatus Eremiobacteraeota bacterium]
LKRWDKDNVMEMDARPDYWGGKPPIDHAVFKPIPENASRVAALKTGETDLITNVPFQYALSIEGAPNTRMRSVRSVRVLFIAFNTHKPGPQNNKLVRQAINYAVDVPAIIKSVLGGRAYELATPIPPGFIGYDPKIPGYAHDVAKAKALLAQAGYPDGKGLDLVVNAPQGRYNKDKEIAEAVAGQLNAIGIKATARPQSWQTYFTQISNQLLEPMYMLGWGNNTYDADFSLAPHFSSEGRFATWSTPEMDKLIEEARYELDPVKRQHLYSRILMTIHEEAPWIFLFQYEDLYATSKRLVWQPRGDEQIFVTDMKLR